MRNGFRWTVAGSRWVGISLLVIFAFHFSLFTSTQAQTAIGHWRDCLDYSMVRHVQPAGRYVYGAARGGVICYDIKEDTVVRLNKTTGLSDVGVATMAYDSASRTLVVAYSNATVDLLQDGTV